MQKYFFPFLLMISVLFCYNTYTVKPGDNYYKIGRHFHVDYRELARLNNKKLKAGQIIKIPGYLLYKVLNGDNFFTLSTKFKVKIVKIKKYNKINRLLVGQYIKIPLDKNEAVLLDDINEKKKKVRLKIISKKVKSRDFVTKKPSARISKKKVRDKTINKSKRRSKIRIPKFVWPVNGKVISAFGMDKNIMNYGLLIKTQNKKVLSSESGIVFYLGKIRGLGTTILLLHQEKYLTIYTGLKNVFCKKGDLVKKGQKIADLKKNEIFFSIFNNGDPKNPLSYLKGD